MVTSTPEAPVVKNKPEAPVVKNKPVILTNNNTISAQEYSDQISLSLAQLETVALMLQALDQADGGQTP